MVMPLRSRKSACVRQSSRETPSTTQSCLTNWSSWSEKSVVTMVQPGRAVLRIEIQHHVLLALEGRQADRPACRRRAARTTEQVVPVPACCGDSIPKLFYFDKRRARLSYRALHIIARHALPLLGGLTPRAFLRRHWQKRPLFVRAALPQFTGVVDKRSAHRARARATTSNPASWNDAAGAWDTRTGRSRALPSKKSNSTLLVSGVNHHVAAADELLRRFAFVPQARLDDVMVSYATPGGGVGPHVDSYDVFLLQGAAGALALVASKTEQYLAQPGDLLYLPPGVRHDGVALDPCFTYSIGFRAPRGAELAAAFLDWLHERGPAGCGLPRRRACGPARRAGRDPGRDDLLRRRPARDASAGPRARRGTLPGRIPERAQAARGVPPGAAGARARALAWSGSMRRRSCSTRGRRFFINGESFEASRARRRAAAELADRRSAAARGLPAPRSPV